RLFAGLWIGLAEQCAFEAAFGFFEVSFAIEVARGVELTAGARETGEHIRPGRDGLEGLCPQAARVIVIPGAVERAKRMDKRAVNLLADEGPRKQARQRCHWRVDVGPAEQIAVGRQIVPAFLVVALAAAQALEPFFVLL